eukprot:scaffold2549_cov343-Prasinococcus_capsulatus_cf.AAC.9
MRLRTHATADLAGVATIHQAPNGGEGEDGNSTSSTWPCSAAAEVAQQDVRFFPSAASYRSTVLDHYMCVDRDGTTDPGRGVYSCDGAEDYAASADAKNSSGSGEGAGGQWPFASVAEMTGAIAAEACSANSQWIQLRDSVEAQYCAAGDQCHVPRRRAGASSCCSRGLGPSDGRGRRNAAAALPAGGPLRHARGHADGPLALLRRAAARHAVPGAHAARQHAHPRAAGARGGRGAGGRRRRRQPQRGQQGRDGGVAGAAARQAADRAGRAPDPQQRPRAHQPLPGRRLLAGRGRAGHAAAAERDRLHGGRLRLVRGGRPGHVAQRLHHGHLPGRLQLHAHLAVLRPPRHADRPAPINFAAAAAAAIGRARCGVVHRAVHGGRGHVAHRRGQPGLGEHAGVHLRRKQALGVQGPAHARGRERGPAAAGRRLLHVLRVQRDLHLRQHVDRGGGRRARRRWPPRGRAQGGAGPAGEPGGVPRVVAGPARGLADVRAALRAQLLEHRRQHPHDAALRHAGVRLEEDVGGARATGLGRGLCHISPSPRADRLGSGGTGRARHRARRAPARLVAPTCRRLARALGSSQVWATSAASQDQPAAKHAGPSGAARGAGLRWMATYPSAGIARVALRDGRGSASPSPSTS